MLSTVAGTQSLLTQCPAVDLMVSQRTLSRHLLHQLWQLRLHKLKGAAIPPDKSLAKNMLGLEFNIYGYGEGLLRSIFRQEEGRQVGRGGGRQGAMGGREQGRVGGRREGTRGGMEAGREGGTEASRREQGGGGGGREQGEGGKEREKDGESKGNEGGSDDARQAESISGGREG